MRTRECDAAMRAGRLRKAERFLADATVLETMDAAVGTSADSQVTLLVHAGIAAADVLCCARLGRYASGEDHTQAISLLRSVDPSAANHLGRLLGTKSKAAYTDRAVSASELSLARRAAVALVEAARAVRA